MATVVTRRKFLQTAGALAGAAVVTSAIAKPALAAPRRAAAAPDRMGLLTDMTKCIGCRACEAACNKVNGLPPPTTSFSDPAVFDQVRRTSVGAFTVVNRYQGAAATSPVYRKVQCMHCDEPACVSVCPAAALVKTPEGPVIWDSRVCIGCRYCMVACPFYVPAFEYSNAFSPRILKCTMCYDRVFKQGGIPACAEACPTKATIYGKKSDLLVIAQQRVMSSPGKYVNQVFGQNEVGGTSWLYLSPVAFQSVGFPKVENTPYGEYTWDFLTAVPVVLVLWPLLMLGIQRFGQKREERAAELVLERAASRKKEEAK